MRPSNVRRIALARQTTDYSVPDSAAFQEAKGSLFTPTSVEQRVRIAVSLLTAQNAGRQVSREQLADHLKDVEASEIEHALGRLQAAGAVHIQGRAIVPRAPPFAGRALPPVVPDASRWSGDSAGRAQPASDG